MRQNTKRYLEVQRRKDRRSCTELGLCLGIVKLLREDKADAREDNFENFGKVKSGVVIQL